MARVTGRTDGRIFGTETYTDDSDLATAAVHAGLLAPGETALVKFRMVDPPFEHPASNQNGVTSNRWGRGFGSFVLLGKAPPSAVAMSNAESTAAEQAGQATGASDAGTPVDNIGRIRTGGAVMAKDSTGKFVRGLALQVYANRTVQVRWEYGPDEGKTGLLKLSDVQPGGSAIVARSGVGPGREILNETEVSPGMKLIGHHAGEWYPVTVVGTKPGRIVITWDGEPPSRNSVPLSWVRFPE